ncbi:MAG: hypothetical protein J2P48_08385 [Alphaproteobacteria bacterium]|nr:hypothetical protein [Alphaproteobacteria bacterium]
MKFLTVYTQPPNKPKQREAITQIRFAWFPDEEDWKEVARLCRIPEERVVHGRRARIGGEPSYLLIVI